MMFRVNANWTPSALTTWRVSATTASTPASETHSVVLVPFAWHVDILLSVPAPMVII